MLDSTTPK